MTLTHIRGGDLTANTAQTPGMTRFEAISGGSVGASGLWMGRTHVAPHANSGNHHHGDTETAIYVVLGNPAFVFAEHGTEVRLETAPGDYIFVPPNVPHREQTPYDEEARVARGRRRREER